MCDPGTYVVACNPADFHSLWAVFRAGDPQLIANGFTDLDRTVWQQTITPEECTTQGSQLTFDFSATATNILPRIVTDAGANISVYVNDTLVGQKDLTGLGPSNPVYFPGRQSRGQRIWSSKSSTTAPCTKAMTSPSTTSR